MSRASCMKPKELAAIIEEVYGTRQQYQLAVDIGRGEVTISRWLHGTAPIGSMEAMLLRLILSMHRRGHNWHKWLRDDVQGKGKGYIAEDVLAVLEREEKQTTVEDFL